MGSPTGGGGAVAAGAAAGTAAAASKPSTTRRPDRRSSRRIGFAREAHFTHGVIVADLTLLAPVRHEHHAGSEAGDRRRSRS